MLGVNAVRVLAQERKEKKKMLSGKGGRRDRDRAR
jgi:hypothetical protein